MPGQTKITATVLEQIPRLIERGLSPDEIATRIGCTIGTLRVVCSKAKISLRRGGRRKLTLPSGSRRRGRAAVALKLPEEAVDVLWHEADKRGLELTALASLLLAMIAQDNLCDAVLDERVDMRADAAARAAAARLFDEARRNVRAWEKTNASQAQ